MSDHKYDARISNLLPNLLENRSNIQLQDWFDKLNLNAKENTDLVNMLVESRCLKQRQQLIEITLPDQSQPEALYKRKPKQEFRPVFQEILKQMKQCESQFVNKLVLFDEVTGFASAFSAKSLESCLVSVENNLYSQPSMTKARLEDNLKKCLDNSDRLDTFIFKSTFETATELSADLQKM